MPRLGAPLFGLLLAIFVAICPVEVRSQEVLEGGAAEVASFGQKELITFSQVRELVGPAEKEAHVSLRGEELVAKIKEIRLAAINDLIDRTLVLQYAKAKQVSIPDDLIDGIIKREFGDDRSSFLRNLAAQGYTLEKFREFQRDTITVERLRAQAGEGAPNPEARKEQEAEWVQSLRKKAYIKIF